jgi:type IV pilus assembly protein PilX
MSTRSLPRLRRPGRPAERGFILVIGLLFMLVLLLLSASMFRSFTMQETMAGNTRDKVRSFEAAQSALQYGESWIASNPGGTPATCGGTLSALSVCSNALSTPQSPSSWSGSYTYVRSDMTSGSSANGLTSDGSDIMYQQRPGLYISYIGLTADGKGQLYQVTAAGYGGSADTTSVVQSTYKLQSATRDLSQ